MALYFLILQRHEFEKKLSQEEDWIRKGGKARRGRNEGRVKALERMREEKKKQRQAVGKVNMQAQEAGRSGHLVIKVSNLGYEYENKPLINSFSTTIMRGDKIGVIGPNGSGKTTLLRLLLEQMTPLRGKVRLGTNLEVAYYDQLREQLDEEKTVMENVSGSGNDTIMINGKPRHIIGYMQDFLFSPERARTPVKVLSGGERNRLLLARLFTRPSNVLVMDEPTNDLDVETLELLEELLLDYQGTLLVVSHDRAFLDNAVTSILVFEGDGRIGEYVGGYTDWLRQRRNPAAPGTEPPRAKTPSPASAAEKRGAKSRKLSYKEQRELETLPAKIESLEAEQTRLRSAVSDPAFYQQAANEITTTLARLEAVTKELETCYARWEALESQLLM